MKNNRISVDNLGILLSLCASLRGEDNFTQIGCAAFNENNEIIGISYNGFAKGQVLTEEFLNDRDNKNLFVRHSETNMLSRHKKGDIKSLYLNYSCCKNCAINICAHDVKRVIYLEEYHREQDFKKIFDFYNVEYKQVTKEDILSIKEFVYGLHVKLIDLLISKQKP